MSADSTLALYDRMGFVYMNRELGMEANTKGVLKKKFKFPYDWQKKTASDKGSNFNGYALITGKTSGITAIDIDDPELEHNRKLIELMSECNLVAKTKKGFHFVYKYNPTIEGKSNNKLALDTRNDDNCIFCQPTRSRFDKEGNPYFSYEWQITPMENEELQEIPEAVLNYLKEISPMFFFQKKEEEAEVEEVEIEETNSFGTEPKNDEPTKDLLVNVVNALPIEYLDNRSDWINIGLVFHNEGYTLEQFKAVSKRSEKYDEEGCIKAWASFKKEHSGRKITSASLWGKLKETNLPMFRALMEKREDFWTLIDILNHNDTSKYFYNNNQDAYLWCEELGWFSLGKNNIWKHYDKGYPSGLKRHLADTLQEYAKESYNAYNFKHARDLSAEADEKKREAMIVRHKKRTMDYRKAYAYFGSSDFCNSVISMLPSLYEKEHLADIMDLNRDVLAFANGCYDLKTLTFRPIQPNDYVSTTTGYDFPTKSDTKVRDELKAMLWSMFENQDVINYVMKVFASCVYGTNRWEEFYVLTGNGRNGKGVLADLLKYTFGDYYLSVDNSLFTKPLERKDQPLPAIVEARPKRIMMTTETESEDKLQVGLLKKISGGDIMEARTLNSKHIVKYVPPYKVFFQVNNIPSLSRVDPAVQNRMRVIGFPNKFVANPTEKNHRPVDPDLKEKKIKSVEWRNEFVLMLLEYYAEIRDLKNLPVPSDIQKTTNDYFDDNNPLKLWLEKFYTITKDENDYVRASVLKRDFITDTRRDNFGDKHFKELLSFNGITSGRKNIGVVFLGLKRKECIVEED